MRIVGAGPARHAISMNYGTSRSRAGALGRFGLRDGLDVYSLVPVSNTN